MCTLTNSIRNHWFTCICMHNTSTLTLSSSASAMFPSTEDQEPSTRDSEYQTGQQLKTLMVAGKSISTHVRHGRIACMICTQSGPHSSSLALVKNPTYSSGWEMKTLERVCLLDSSTMKCHSLPGLDMEVTCYRTRTMNVRETACSILSLTLTRIKESSLVWIPPLQKVLLLSKLNMINFVNWLLRLWRKKTLCFLTKCLLLSRKSHISSVCGNITESICWRWDMQRLSRTVPFLQKMLKLVTVSSTWPELLASTFISWQSKASLLILKIMKASKLLCAWWRLLDSELSNWI